MPPTRLNETLKATARVQRASVQDMSRELVLIRALVRELASIWYQPRGAMRALLAAVILFSLQVLILTPRASAAGLQSNATAAPSLQVASLDPAFSESLRPALQQVGYSVSQIQIDHWRASKSWKAQLQSDADSIAQDLSHQLPALFQQAEAAPSALDAHLRVMQNVDALYDVLVRLTMAADLTGKKTDAALLDGAIERLEAARKTASAQLVNAAASQNRQLLQLQAQAERAANQNVSSAHGKTIVVDNEVRRRPVHRTTHRKKPAASTTGTKSQPNAAQPTGLSPR